MKAALINDQFADVAAITERLEYLRPFVKFKIFHKKPEAIFPAGTVFEGDDALRMAIIGQAMPLDDECKHECGMSEAELAMRQLEYEMNSKGINRKEDRELYKNNIILGYDKDLRYIHGPNWDAYQAAKLDSSMEEDI